MPRTPKSSLSAISDFFLTLRWPGAAVWAESDRLPTLRERVAYLESYAEWFQQHMKSEIVYDELPVRFETFVESDFYMAKRGILYPAIMRDMARLNDARQYIEAVFTGAIGCGKTTAALYTQMYQLYVLSCHRNLHEVFDLDPSSEIVIVFQNVTAALARSVDYDRFRAMLEASPYFRERFPYEENRLSEIRFLEKRIVVKPIGGTDTAVLGQNVIGGMLDEVNFMALVEGSKLAHGQESGVYDQAVRLYSQIARRRESRFMRYGELPGMLCLVSSKNYPGQFTDRKAAEAQTNDRIFVFDKRLWEVAPERFSGKTFPVFIGDGIRKPKVLEEEEVEAEISGAVVQIPVEYENSFKLDIMNALRDIAGVSTATLHPYVMEPELVVRCFGKVPSVASREVVDFENSALLLIPDRISDPREPRYAHIDLGLTSDSCGVAVGYVTGFREVEREEGTGEMLPNVRFDLVLEVRPPPNGEIQFHKIRALLYRLREIGVNLQWVSLDSYQSVDTRQILRTKGIRSGLLSVDKTLAPYDVAKQALYDGRVELPPHRKGMQEWLSLERDYKKGKVDHPPHGSKDVADAIAGVIYGLTTRREIWAIHRISPTQVPVSLRRMARIDREAQRGNLQVS